MKVNKFNMILMLFLLTAQVQANAQLNEQIVTDFMTSLQQAVQEQDVDQFISHFNEEANIQIHMPEFMGGTINTTVKDYREVMTISWGMSAEFTYEIKDMVIELSEDKLSATIKETVIETMAFDGEVMTKTSSDQVTKVALLSGQPKIVSMHAKVTLLAID